MSNIGGHKGDTTKCYCGILDWILEQKNGIMEKTGEHFKNL